MKVVWLHQSPDSKNVVGVQWNSIWDAVPKSERDDPFLPGDRIGRRRRCEDRVRDEEDVVPMQE